MNKSAVFLDRDGVINYDSGYTSSSEQFKFIDGIFELCRAAKQSGYSVIVVTNQAGIGRGYYSEQDFFILTQWMLQRFEEAGAPITDVYYCPYHPKHGLGQYKKNSFNRKPQPGMILQAAEKHRLNLERSIMIGDKDSDMQAAKKAGIRVRCLYSECSQKRIQSSAATCIIGSLREGIDLLNSLDKV